MRTIKFLASLILLTAAIGLKAQSVDYSGLEKRFVKDTPDARDTVAFRQLGEQKVRQLFDKSRFHAQNYSNTSNQVYIKQQIPDLFYIAPDDTLDVNGLLRAIEKAEILGDQTIALRTIPAKGFLGLTETLNCDPKFSFYLVLMQVPKNFGKEQELVWEVYLRNTEQHAVKPQKVSKSKAGR